MDINRKSNSYRTAIVLFFIVFSSLENGVLGQCKKNPVNRAVFEGTKDIVMSCAPNPVQVEWRGHLCSDELDSTVLNNDQGVVASSAREAFSIDPNNGLIIFEATITEEKFRFSTAGIYVGEYQNQTRLVAAKFVVVREGPVCTFDVSSPANGDKVTINCTTAYADHSVHPIRPFMTVKLGDEVIAAETLKTYRINQYMYFAWLSVRFTYNACLPIEVVQTFDPPTDLQYKFIAKNAPAFINSVTFPATSEDCLRYPRNIAVREGAKNTVMYSTHNPVTVQRKISPTSDQLAVYPISDFDKGVFPNVSSLFAVNKSGLVIIEAIAEAGQYPMSTSGFYTETYRNGETRGAKLIVVRSGPTCSSSPEDGGSVKLTCTFEFADHSVHAISPSISFKRNGAVKATFTPPRIRKNQYTLSASAWTSFSNDPSAADECVVGFNPPPSNDQYSYVASNAPDYTDSCNY